MTVEKNHLVWEDHEQDKGEHELEQDRLRNLSKHGESASGDVLVEVREKNLKEIVY